MSAFFKEYEIRNALGQEREYEPQRIIARGTLAEWMQKQAARRPRREAKRKREEEAKLAKLERAQEASRLGRKRFERREYERSIANFRYHAGRLDKQKTAGQSLDPLDLRIAKRNMKEMEDYERANRT